LWRRIADPYVRGQRRGARPRQHFPEERPIR
jgi:hypothetical protein